MNASFAFSHHEIGGTVTYRTFSDTVVYLARELSPCPWCGKRPRVTAHRSPFRNAIVVAYRCHYRTRLVTVDETTIAWDVGAAFKSLWKDPPFPLPPRPGALPPIIPRGWVTGPDGARTWLMGPRT